MNLYLVLALALGVSSPTVQPRMNSVAAECKLPSRRAVSLAVRRSPLAGKSVFGQRSTANGQPADVPLTGAATPRAPAFSC